MLHIFVRIATPFWGFTKDFNEIENESFNQARVCFTSTVVFQNSRNVLRKVDVRFCLFSRKANISRLILRQQQKWVNNSF